jgi:hypothetical protein
LTTGVSASLIALKGLEPLRGRHADRLGERIVLRKDGVDELRLVVLLCGVHDTLLLVADAHVDERLAVLLFVLVEVGGRFHLALGDSVDVVALFLFVLQRLGEVFVRLEGHDAVGDLRAEQVAQLLLDFVVAAARDASALLFDGVGVVGVLLHDFGEGLARFERGVRLVDTRLRLVLVLLDGDENTRGEDLLEHQAHLLVSRVILLAQALEELVLHDAQAKQQFGRFGERFARARG